MNKKTQQIYVNEYYNTRGLYTNSTSGGLGYATSHINNALIEGLNTFEHLPKYLIVISDLDVIKDVKEFNFGVYKALSAIMNWLTRQIDIVLCRKCLQLMEKKPGAVNDTDPTIINVNAVRRVEFFRPGSKLESYCSVRTKFNDTLNDCVARQDQRILTIRSCTTMDHFDQWGKLSAKGKSLFWFEMDDLLERFDKGGLLLLPRSTHEFQPRCHNGRMSQADHHVQAQKHSLHDRSNHSCY